MDLVFFAVLLKAFCAERVFIDTVATKPYRTQSLSDSTGSTFNTNRGFFLF